MKIFPIFLLSILILCLLHSSAYAEDLLKVLKGSDPFDTFNRKFCRKGLTLSTLSTGVGEKEGVKLEPIILNITKTPTEYSKVSRNVYIIEEDYIRDSKATSVEGLLRDIGGMEIRHRGPYGVQADLSVRGSTYSQNLLLINGIRVNDPQTAHHNFDIGLTLDSIERIEVLPGHGSSLYGADAFGGVINIVTKKPEKKKVLLDTSYGSNETISSSFFFSDYWKNIGGVFSFENKESNGYRYDTDFKIRTFTTSLIAEWEETKKLDLLFGYTEKEFGANDFYAAYPSKEWTRTFFTTANLKIGKKAILEPRFYFRRHFDKYILDIKRPAYYRNDHMTDMYGAEIQFLMPMFTGHILGGLEGSQEKIESTNLGDHKREHGALFINGNLDIFEKILVDGGIRMDGYSKFEAQYSPSLSLAYIPFSNTKLRSSIGRSFRVPSYTELYYDSPSNKGSANLNPEKATSFEAGIDYGYKMDLPFDVSLTLFRREEEDLIDWIKSPPTAARYEAQNITHANIKGLETRLKIRPVNFISTMLSYSYIDSDVKREGNYISKYALNHPEHQINGSIDFILPFGTQRINLLYKDRKTQRDYLLLDLRFSIELKKGTELYLDVLNLSDEDYEEIQGIPMPRISFQTGLRMEF